MGVNMEGWMGVGQEARRVARLGAKALVANVLEQSGGRRMLSLVRRHSQGSHRVQILAWHRVVPDFAEMRRRCIPGLFTSTRTFEAQLRWLRAHYRIVRLDEALDALSGKIRMEADLCVLTFDDGYADFWTHAAPILRKYDLPALMYVPTAFVDNGMPLLHDRLYHLLRLASRRGVELESLRGDPRMERAAARAAAREDEIWRLENLLETQPRAVCVLVAEALEERLGEAPEAALPDSRLLTWDELRAMRAAGFEVGAHTVDHSCLPNETPEEVVHQLRASRQRFEAELGEDIHHFAYPNGWYSRGVIRALIREGYRSATTTEDRANRPEESPFTLKRKCVWEYTSRGLWGYSHAVNACNLDDTLGFLGLAPWTPGEKPDALLGGAGPRAGAEREEGASAATAAGTVA